MCVYDGCKNWTGFNFEGLKARYCSIHKEEGMVDVKNKTCDYVGCRKQPAFNFEGELKGIYCSIHKKEGMVNVKSKLCSYIGCKTIPCYNFEGEKKGLYCSIHKEDGMVNIIDKKCKYKGCKTIPRYNFEGNKIGLYCSVHKEEGMENVKTKRCFHEGCKTIPIYNYESETIGMYCLVHKKEDMVNVISKKCNDERCKKQPAYNYEGELNGIYCLEHKKDGMVNVISKTCINDWCPKIVGYNNKYEGYCLRCYIYTFPDKPVARNYKTKERAVVDFVCERFPEHTWITDKKVNDGCSMRRPDILVDLGYQVLIIEIDENAHQDYDCSCENKRIMELSQDVGHRPIIFIRFNPDSYRMGDKKIPSCWEQNMNGICVVKYKDDWEHRLSTLETQIKYWTSISNSTNKIIETIHLFYDTAV